MKKGFLVLAVSLMASMTAFAGQEGSAPEEIIYQPALNHYIEARSLSLSGANQYAVEQSCDVDSRPIVPYYNLLFDPLLDGVNIYSGLYNIYFDGSLSNVVDHGDYYEFKNQQLKRIKVFQTEAEAKNSPDYDKRYCTVYKIDDLGKYGIYAEGSFMSEEVYSGSFYINKNAVVSDEQGVSEGGVPNAVYRLDEYLSKIQAEGSYFGTAHITLVDEKGYGTFVTLYNH